MDPREQRSALLRLVIVVLAGLVVAAYFGALATVRDELGPVFVLRYNMLTATAINGAVFPNVSSGNVIATMEKLCQDELPRNMDYEWSELTFMEMEANRAETVTDLLHTMGPEKTGRFTRTWVSRS